MLTYHRWGIPDLTGANELKCFLFVLTLFCQLWGHHVYVCYGQMMGQISPAGFQSLEYLYFWYVTIEINDFLNWKKKCACIRRTLIVSCIRSRQFEVMCCDILHIWMMSPDKHIYARSLKAIVGNLPIVLISAPPTDDACLFRNTLIAHGAGIYVVAVIAMKRSSSVSVLERNLQVRVKYSYLVSLINPTWTKWPPFCRRYSQMHFREW